MNWVQNIRKAFPILKQTLHEKKLVYLDNAATTQKPLAMLDAMDRFYKTAYSNTHRGAHTLSETATHAYEQARKHCASFLGASDAEEIVFTKGTTESLNLLAETLKIEIQPKDWIFVSTFEHHSNFLPWKRIAQEKDAFIYQLQIEKNNLQLDLKTFQNVLREKKPKILALTLMSNVIGNVLPITDLALEAKKAGAWVIIDGAQGVPHLFPKLSDLGPIDALVFSPHKLYGPTGIGVLWARKTFLERFEPYQVGGGMIAELNEDQPIWLPLPFKWEAGTPPIAEAIALDASLSFLENIGLSQILEQEKTLEVALKQTLLPIPGIRCFHDQNNTLSAPIWSFELEGIHPHDLATFLDHLGIAIRVGHHCAIPLLQALKTSSLSRVSGAFYNTVEEIQYLGTAIREAQKFFQKRRNRI